MTVVISRCTSTAGVEEQRPPEGRRVPADDEMNRTVDTFNDEMNRRFAAEPGPAVEPGATQTAPPASIAGDHFLGEKNCRRCHEAEYNMYSSQDHARAFATLTKNQRDSSPECLPCHVVGYGQPGGGCGCN